MRAHMYARTHTLRVLFCCCCLFLFKLYSSAPTVCVLNQFMCIVSTLPIKIWLQNVPCEYFSNSANTFSKGRVKSLLQVPHYSCKNFCIIFLGVSMKKPVHTQIPGEVYQKGYTICTTHQLLRVNNKDSRRTFLQEN